MHIKRSQSRFLPLIGLGVLFGLAPLACGSDEDNVGDGTGASSGSGGKNTGGSGGKSTGGSSSGGSSSGGSSSGATNSLGGAAAGEAGMGGAGGSGEVTTAKLRVVHASPNAPSIDIYAEDATTAAAEDVAYGSATDFIEVPAGPIAFDLRAAGADAGDAPAFTSAEIELSAGEEYTLVAAGDFAALDDADTGFRIVALEHDFDTPSAGHALARIVHATSAWGTVDLDLAATTALDLPGLEPFASESNVELAADADFDVAFSTESAGTLSKLTVPELTAGEQLFVIATGNPGFPFRAPANGFALLVVDQDGNVSWVLEQPWVHLVNASDVSTVDVYNSAATASASKLLDNLAAATTAAFQLPASAAGYTLKAVADDAASGSATALATGPTSTLEEGEHYLAYIASSSIQTLHEQFDLEQPTKVMLRGVHASATITGTVDFGAVTLTALTSALISEVAPDESSADAGVAIDPGAVTLGAAATGTLTPLLAAKAFTAAGAPIAGERAFAMLVGTGDIWLVDTSVAGWTVR